MTATIHSLSAVRDMRNRINIAHPDRAVCADIASTILLRPGPAETPTMFVARIVRAYLEGVQNA